MNKYNEISIITLCIDFCLIYILLTQKLNRFELNIIYAVFIIHIIFLYALHKKNQYLIDIMHVMFVFYIYVLSFFVKNFYLSFLFLILFIMMILYWIIDNKCPIGEYNTIPLINNMVKKYPHYIIWSLTIIPIYSLLKRIFKKSLF